MNPMLTRREMLRRAGGGAGLLGLATLLSDARLLQAGTHHPAKAKSIIWLFLNGGASQVDTFDYKPELAKRDGQELPGFDTKTAFFVAQTGKLFKSPFKFSQHGSNGTWISELFPGLARHVDDMAFMYSCHAESNNHGPALFQINSGLPRMGFPSLGSWLTYGLGHLTQNLPSFVVMTDTLGRGLPKNTAQNWGAGFLPGSYQGTALAFQGPPVRNLQPAEPADRQRAQLDLLRSIDLAGEPEFEARLQSYETAYRMQSAAPEAFAIDTESDDTKRAYGLDRKECGHFARQCLLARRLVERGVRVVQVYSGGYENERSWDGHIDINGNHRQFAGETDQPMAALLDDLKRRGLLESTLVLCCGEFGRLPVAQVGPKPGRDHNPRAFTAWLAGGGVRAGARHGATDEFGYQAVQDKVSVHDLHATVLHLLGLDHEKLTYRFNGRDYRLTDVAGKVVRPVVA
ncbi:MAG: DUF1501 domain-containing protein [Gemmataceae bacterium]|nr:DUF1501 domain-containing protein [Gemmataceae bacterium]